MAYDVHEAYKIRKIDDWNEKETDILATRAYCKEGKKCTFFDMQLIKNYTCYRIMMLNQQRFTWSIYFDA